MITRNSLEKLQTFKVAGFIEELVRQDQNSCYNDLSFEERMTLLIDAEFSRRFNYNAQKLIKQARISSAISLDDVDFSLPRELKKTQFLELSQGHWLQNGTNLIITGPTGIGKTFLASVIAGELCRRAFAVRFQRTHLWLADFFLSDERHRFLQSVATLRRITLIVFDEWLRDPIPLPAARLLLDFFDDRYQHKSIMLLSQLKIHDWHSRFEDPTLADAILDRIIHNSIRLDLTGESVRKLKANHSSLPRAETPNVTPLRLP